MFWIIFLNEFDLKSNDKKNVLDSLEIILKVEFTQTLENFKSISNYLIILSFRIFFKIHKKLKIDLFWKIFLKKQTEVWQ